MPYSKHSIAALNDLDLMVHTPARLMILTVLLSSENRDFLQLMEDTGLSWGNLSSHLSKLEEADYVKIRKTYKGKRPSTVVSITNSGRSAYEKWVRMIQQVLPSESKTKWETEPRKGITDWLIDHLSIQIHSLPEMHMKISQKPLKGYWHNPMEPDSYKDDIS